MVGLPKGRADSGAEPRARVFQGGTYHDLHKMLHVTSGAQVRGSHKPPQAPILHSKPGLLVPESASNQMLELEYTPCAVVCL